MRVSRVVCWVLTRQLWWSVPVDFLKQEGHKLEEEEAGTKGGFF